MLSYRDFAPDKGDKTLTGVQWKGLDSALTAANSWIAQESIEPLHVETVVLPNMYAPGETGTGDAAVPVAFGMANFYQFIRVWYQPA